MKSEKILNKNEMEELMPDYVFGKLTDDEIKAFEGSLPSYPDIQDEVFRAKAVFKEAEQIDINQIISQKTRNLSVKVNERLVRRAQKRAGRRFLLRYVVPVAAVIAIFMFVISPDNTQNEITGGNDEIAEAINNINFDEVLGSSSADEFPELSGTGVEAAGAINDLAIVGENMEEQIDEEFDSFFFANVSAVESATESNSANMSPFFPASLTVIEDLTNEEFQELLEAMKNETYI